MKRILFQTRGDLRKERIKKFKEAIDYQQEELRKKIEQEKERLGRGINKFDLGAYKNFFDMIKELMCDGDGEKPKKAFVSMISNENRFKAFLDGLFTGLSDLDKDRIIAVLTEFQVGGGGRVDIMIQVIGKKNFDEEREIGKLGQSVSMGIEVKYEEIKNKAGKKMEEAGNQVEEYAKSPNIKSITEGDKVVFMVVVFDGKADSKDKLILLSKELILADVPHSSTDISLRSQMSELSLQDPQQSIAFLIIVRMR